MKALANLVIGVIDVHACASRENILKLEHCLQVQSSKNLFLRAGPILLLFFAIGADSALLRRKTKFVKFYCIHVTKILVFGQKTKHLTFVFTTICSS